MKIHFSSAACAAALLFAGVSADAVLAPASAQADVSVNFDTFHDQLSPYGDWVYSDRWGEIWIPQDVPDDFHPYGTRGHWAYTNYGWTWVSDYEWGDIAFHYGRWVNDPDDGWLWIPGYVWSPGWVVWRSNGQYTGWMPMPPDDEFLGIANRGTSLGISIGGGGLGFSIDFNNTNDYYGYSRWYGHDYGENQFASNWVFVGTGHMADRDYSRYEAPRSNYATIIRATNNITNYAIVNNYVVNRSVDVHQVERASGHSVLQVRAADVFRNAKFITRADAGHDVQIRMREQNPRGNGEASSAPKPPASVIQTLSVKIGPRNGHQPAHLFTRDTVTSAPLPQKPMGVIPAGPGNERNHEENGNRGANPLMGMPHANPAEPNPAGPADHHGKENGATTNPPAETPPANPAEPGNAAPGGMHHHAGETGGATTNPPAEMPPANPAEPGNAAPGGMHHHAGETGGATTNPPAETPPANPAEPGNAAPGGMHHHEGETGGATTNPPTETPHANSAEPGNRGDHTMPAMGHEPAAGGTPAAHEPATLQTPNKGASEKKDAKKHKPDESGAPQ